MALIVVGGQTKHVGKTTLICNIIRSFPQCKWIAVKFTPHPHAPSDTGQVATGLGWAISEQYSSSDGNDTAKFLLAGADRALLMYSEAAHFPDACADLLQCVSNADNAVIESSSVVNVLHADLSLLVIDPSRADFKSSAKEQLASADALLVREPQPPYDEGWMQSATKIPIFRPRLAGLDPELMLLLKSVLHCP
ncbi:MAG TPA: hypothetical protein VM912_20265 [Terriglobales bacterium]|nr:hypothetical protein [Terriglobales bacterium]